MKKNTFLILLASCILFFIFMNRDFTSKYEQTIQSDAIGYYSYLPAIFIYKDLNYQFIKENMYKYYPENYEKQFLNKQKNGKFVNKCFPGLAILYLPFFILASIFTFLFSYPLDGFSLFYQISIAIAPVVYFSIGLHFLYRFLFHLFPSDKIIQLAIVLLTFGSNLWFYLVFDHTLSHVYLFVLFSCLLYLFQSLIVYQKSSYLNYILILFTLSLIIRPTSILLLLFLPFILELHRFTWKELLNLLKPIKTYLLGIVISCILLFIPFLLWKLQADLWLVYSYNDEKFDFSKPHVFEFLFSYKKGWLLWSPILMFFLLFSFFYFYRFSKKLIIYFFVPLFALVYIFSSWWIWTFGMGLGQRPMIDFYPLLTIGFVGFFYHLKQNKKLLIIVLFPFLMLNLLQAYQIANSILIGGNTTETDYWNHFLQWKTDAPKVKIAKDWNKISTKTWNNNEVINKKSPFTKALHFHAANKINYVLIELEISGTHKDKYVNLVLTNSDASFYKSEFIGRFLYVAPRKMQFLFDVSTVKNQEFSTYVWNGDSKAETFVKNYKVTMY